MIIGGYMFQTLAAKIVICGLVILASFCAGLYIMGQYKDAKIKVIQADLKAEKEKRETAESANGTLVEKVKNDQQTCNKMIKSKDATIKKLRGIDAYEPKKDETGNLLPDDPLLSELNSLWREEANRPE